MTSWSNRISFTRPHHDLRENLLKQLEQDGLSESELHVPPIGSEAFLQLIHDSESFAAEFSAETSGCPVRAGRWLQRIAVAIVDRSYLELPHTGRQAISHAAIMLAGRPELLR